MANTLIDSLLAEIEKTAEGVAAEKKEEKKEVAAEKKEEKKEESKEASAVLSTLSPEMLDKLASVIESMQEIEKTAELEKVAEELETQGRFMYHGFLKEQVKVAYLLETIEDEDVVKVAETLGWDVEDILKTSNHVAVVGAGQNAVEGLGIKGGPAGDTISGDKTTGVAAKAPGQIERKQETSGELAQLKNIINKVKASRKEVTGLEVNG